MILKRETHPNYIECLYESTNVLASKYNLRDGRLAIIFKSGRQYVYEDVLYKDYEIFEKSSSQGAVVKQNLGKYSYDLATTIDTSFFEANINYLKSLKKK